MLVYQQEGKRRERGRRDRQEEVVGVAVAVGDRDAFCHEELEVSVLGTSCVSLFLLSLSSAKQLPPVPDLCRSRLGLGGGGLELLETEEMQMED